mmetsp:Transcript_13540/g.13278  ORF Transcript_13540/g.13278 Transcript_13540/m.13278 type:complete len:88 (-) Transcript_13540:984-1247(-)
MWAGVFTSVNCKAAEFLKGDPALFLSLMRMFLVEDIAERDGKAVDCLVLSSLLSHSFISILPRFFLYLEAANEGVEEKLLIMCCFSN